MNSIVTKEMVLDRLRKTKDEAVQALNALREKKELREHGLMATLEETIETIDALITEMPWDKLSQTELEKWYGSNGN